jgi:hypothetical protein
MKSSGSSHVPGWVVDDVTSVREEVKEWAGLTPAQLWQLGKLCARDAMWAARARGMRERILEHTDPVPPSTILALARLRRLARSSGERF